MPRSVAGWLHALMLAAAAVLFALHFVHLAADFPNSSPWMDWSKYTDEGWYGDGAIRHFQLGHWYVAGDFNPAIALPVWPLLEGLLFHFTGVSLVAARTLTVCVFGGILVAGWFLVRRWRPRGHFSLAASAAVLLLAASPFCFVFTRMAILEPFLVMLTLLALLAAGDARTGGGTERLSVTVRGNLRVIVALGLLLPAMVLTKTTGLFLVPAVAWLLFASVGYKTAMFVRVAAPAATLALAIWLGYYGLVVRPHFLLDYRYLFSANAYTGITRENFVQVLRDTVADGMWMGRVIYPLALVAAVGSLVWRRVLKSQPLVPALLLWACGYAAFLAYHDNLQPRYYLVIAVPLTLLVPVVADCVAMPKRLGAKGGWLGLGVAAAAMLVVVIPDARQTVEFVRRPQYTLLTAARSLNDYIQADRRVDPSHNPLLLSISGSDISLMTGLPSICDDFGTLELPDRVKKYRPGWYAAWNQIDDDKMDAMTPLFQVERVAAFPAMDDPDRNLLILYKLNAAVALPPVVRRVTPTPRRLRTRIGQQPSVEQLEH